MRPQGWRWGSGGDAGLAEDHGRVHRLAAAHRMHRHFGLPVTMITTKGDRGSGSSVRLPAKPLLALGMLMAGPCCCLAGRPALPLDPGDGGHRGMPTEPQGQAVEPTKSAMHDLAGRGPAQESGWLAGRLRLGAGHASTVRPDPSTLGVGGERGSHRESCSQLGSGRRTSDPGSGAVSCDSTVPLCSSWVRISMRGTHSGAQAR
jgi:hypothetical protein